MAKINNFDTDTAPNKYWVRFYRDLTPHCRVMYRGMRARALCVRQWGYGTMVSPCSSPPRDKGSPGVTLTSIDVSSITCHICIYDVVSRLKLWIWLDYAEERIVPQSHGIYFEKMFYVDVRGTPCSTFTVGNSYEIGINLNTLDLYPAQ